MNKKNTTEVVIGIIAILAIIISGFFWLQNQTKFGTDIVSKENQINNSKKKTLWKTYKYEGQSEQSVTPIKYAFEFKYPEDFRVEGENTENIVTIKPITNNVEVPFMEIQIIFMQPEELLVDSAVSRLTDTNEYREVVNKEIVINGLRGKIIGNSGNNNTTKSLYREIIIRVDENKILFVKSVELEDDILNQILYSIKINTDEIADWQTYRNEQYGFELKYPKIFSINDNKEDKTLSIGNVAFEPAPGAMFIGVKDKNISQYRDFIKENWEGMPCTAEESVSFSNYNFQRVVCPEAFAGGEIEMYFIEYNQHIYTIDFIRFGNEKNDAEFRNILSTIKFIN